MFEFNATLIVAAFSFIIFTLIMNKILYQPINDIILKRQKYIDENSCAAKNNVEQAVSLQKGREEKLAGAKADAGKTVTEKVSEIKAQKAQKEIELKNSLNQEVSAKKSELLSEKEHAQNELNNEVDNLTNAILSKLAGGEG